MERSWLNYYTISTDLPSFVPFSDNGYRQLNFKGEPVQPVLPFNLAGLLTEVDKVLQNCRRHPVVFKKDSKPFAFIEETRTRMGEVLVVCGISEKQYLQDNQICFVFGNNDVEVFSYQISRVLGPCKWSYHREGSPSVSRGTSRAMEEMMMVAQNLSNPEFVKRYNIKKISPRRQMEVLGRIFSPKKDRK